MWIPNIRKMWRWFFKTIKNQLEKMSHRRNCVKLLNNLFHQHTKISNNRVFVNNYCSSKFGLISEQRNNYHTTFCNLFHAAKPSHEEHKALQQVKSLESKFEELLQKKISNEKSTVTNNLDAQNLVLSTNNLYDLALEHWDDESKSSSEEELTIIYKLAKLKVRLLLRDFYKLDVSPTQLCEEVLEECHKLAHERPYLIEIIKEELTEKKEIEKYQKGDPSIEFPTVEGFDLESKDIKWLKYFVYDRFKNNRIGAIRTKKTIIYKELEDLIDTGLNSSFELGPQVAKEDYFIFAFYQVVHFFSRMDEDSFEKIEKIVRVWDKSWKEEMKDFTFLDWETGVPLRLDSCMTTLKSFIVGFKGDDDADHDRARKLALSAQKMDPNNFYVFTLDFGTEADSYMKNILKTERIILEKGQVKSLQQLRFFPLLYNKANILFSTAAMIQDQKRIKFAKQALDALTVSFNSLHVPMDPSEVQTMADCKFMMGDAEAAFKLYMEFFEVQFTSGTPHIVHAVEVCSTTMAAFSLRDNAITSLDRYCRLLPEEYTTSLKLHLISILIGVNQAVTKSPQMQQAPPPQTPQKLYKGNTLKEELEWCKKEMVKIKKNNRNILESDPGIRRFFDDTQNALEEKVAKLGISVPKPKPTLKATTSKLLFEKKKK